MSSHRHPAGTDRGGQWAPALKTDPECAEQDFMRDPGVDVLLKDFSDKVEEAENLLRHAAAESQFSGNPSGDADRLDNLASDLISSSLNLSMDRDLRMIAEDNRSLRDTKDRVEVELLRKSDSLREAARRLRAVEETGDAERKASLITDAHTILLKGYKDGREYACPECGGEQDCYDDDSYYCGPCQEKRFAGE